MKGPGLLALATYAEGGGSASPGLEEEGSCASLAPLQAVAPQAEIGSEEFRAAQEADPHLQPLRCQAAANDATYHIHDGLLYCAAQGADGVDLLVVRAAFEDVLLREYHDGMSHLGVWWTLACLREKYWFPRMRARVEAYIQACDVY